MFLERGLISEQNPLGPAYWYSGQTASRRAVQLLGRPESLLIVFRDENPAKCVVWPRQHTRVDALAAQLWGPDGQLLQLEPGPALAGVLAWRQDRSPTAAAAAAEADKAFSSTQRQWLRGTLWLSLAALVMCSAVWGSQRLAQKLAPHIPMAWEKQLLVAVRPRLALHFCETMEQAEVLERLTKRLSEHLSERLALPGGAAPGALIELHVVDMGPANAMALPGGLVLIESKLLRMAESP